MEGTPRKSTPALKQQLLTEGSQFSFFQAIRLLQRILREDYPHGNPWSRLRIHPRLSLSFPDTDLHEIKKIDESYHVTANFFGLYGVSSPLPTFYTEDLLEEQRSDRRATRDFLDIFHHALYPLFFEAWAKYKQALRIIEEHHNEYLDQIYSLIGLGSPSIRAHLPAALPVLRYAGLFTQYPRSATGLRTMLSDALNGLPVEVNQCLPRMIALPADQRLQLGQANADLGENSILGVATADRQGSIHLVIGPLQKDIFMSLLPGAQNFLVIEMLLRLYLNIPLLVSVELMLAQGEVRAARLGDPLWGRLGLTCWSFSGDFDHEVRAVFRI